ncbi:MAG: glycogen debranching protein GlgX [Thermomicrobiales bacterium]
MSQPHEQARIRPGHPYPLGSTWDGNGTNFAVFSAFAEAIEVCLYEDGEGTPSRVFRLPERTTNVWHGYIPGVTPGTRYGLRAYGPFDPERGMRFNSAKVLLDPYAKAIHGKVTWNPAVYSYDFDNPEDDLSLDGMPSDEFMPKAIVVDPAFDWGDDRRLDRPWEETIVYEVHVKGFTRQHPDIPEELRGTYQGLAHPAAIAYLQKLGITAVELLPVHAFVDDQFLVSKGLKNYWGYSTLGFFAPEERYAANRTAGGQVNEFRNMVKALHAAGIEVILDVVFNHSCEGNHLGPTLSFRGLDNTSYYRLLPDKPRYYMDLTGTGNTLNLAHPQVLKLVTDSLRYWVEEMHVDGFRFDLAATLGREHVSFDSHGGFFDAIHQDPILSRVKLIAEPWDIGEGGYQVGNFPLIWSEWNDRFRDGVRTLWQTQNEGLADVGYRLSGSSDLYQAGGRRPRASINLITAHDGFTLTDLVSYATKHNEANGEDNRDGNDHNISANYGVEGPTDDVAILDLRDRQRRNMMAFLLFSQGVPMISGGDEIGRTQDGNNNAYCQDDEISWFAWSTDERDQAFFDFVAKATRIRQEFPILRLRQYLRGQPTEPGDLKDLTWFRPDGGEMVDGNWTDPSFRAMALRISGNTLQELAEDGTPLTSPTMLMVFNASENEVTFTLPEANRDDAVSGWRVLVDTDDPRGASDAILQEKSDLVLPARTVMLCESMAADSGA